MSGTCAVQRTMSGRVAEKGLVILARGGGCIARGRTGNNLTGRRRRGDVLPRRLGGPARDEAKTGPPLVRWRGKRKEGARYCRETVRLDEAHRAARACRYGVVL